MRFIHSIGSGCQGNVAQLLLDVNQVGGLIHEGVVGERVAPLCEDVDVHVHVDHVEGTKHVSGHLLL